MLKFSMLLQAIDRVTGPAKRIQASMAGIGKASKKLGGDLGVSSKAYDRGYALGNKLRGGLDRLAGGFARVGRMAKLMAAAGVNSFGAAAKRAVYATGRLIKKMGGMALGAAKWAGAGAVAGGGFGLFDLFKTAGEFEQFQIQLEGLMGSAEKGKAAFGWIKKFSADTPFELAEVTEAFVLIKNAGIDPMKGALAAAGDAAAGMSKPIGQAAEAIADAMTGEFERLKGLGITASVAGNKVRLSWIKNEKEISKVVDKTDRVAVAMAVAAGWADKFGGATKRQSLSLFGIIANIKDKWSEFMVMIADAGIFDRVKVKLQEWLDNIGVMAKDGRLQAWAEKISKFLEQMWDRAVTFIETDWTPVINDLAKVGKAVMAIADGILAITKYWGMFSGAVSTTSRIMNPMNFSGAMMAGGKGLITGDPVGGMKKGVGIFLGVPPAKPGGAPKPAGPVGTLPSNFMRPKIGMNDNRVGGAVRVIIEAKGDISARTASISSDNTRVPVIVNTGRTMAGAA